jgi:hypothetical protein
MSSDIVLVPGPFVRASSWGATADYLREAGYKTQIPDVLADQTVPPAWSDWTSRLLELISSPLRGAVLVGHSSAGPLVADLASKISCQAIIIVDGHIPPIQGLAEPVTPALREFVQRLPASGGLLPIWSEWFRGDPQREALIGLRRLADDSLVFANFESGLRRFPVEWIEDAIPVANWDGVPAGFIQTSEIYDYAAEEAQRRGWPVIKVHGTHMHPMLEPAETADAIVAMIRQLSRVALA